MTTFGISPLSSNDATRFVEASDASELQRLLAAELVDIGDNVDGDIVAVNLAGAGDGYTFITEFVVSNDPTGTSYDPAEMRLACYRASSAEELARARVPVVAALLAEDPPIEGQELSLVDEQLVGASKGTAFMGLLIGVWATPDGGG